MAYTTQFSWIKATRDISFNNVGHIMWELWAKNAFALKIMLVIVGVWVTGVSLDHPYECHFHKSYGVGTVPNIKLDGRQRAT